MATRRGFLSALAALALPLRSWAEVGSPSFLAAGKDGEVHVLHGMDVTGDSLFRIDLPGRGHAAAAHPTRPLAVAFARRPGTFAVVLDCRSGEEVTQLTPPSGRQFNGHGVFSLRGDVLFTSEVVAATSEGRIGIWETERFSRVGEWNSGGIGPHDMKRMVDGGLVVANGGIATDPADRTKLNIETMRPNVTLLGPDGRITAQAELPPDMHQNSIRHLALARDGRVAFAMQWEGDPAIDVPQLGLWSPGSDLQLCPPSPEDAFRMKGYAGSIAISNGQIALTSPRGGVVMVHGSDGAHLATHARDDACGVAASADGFVVTDGAGAVWHCDAAGLTLLRRDGPSWDNHLVALG